MTERSRRREGPAQGGHRVGTGAKAVLAVASKGIRQQAEARKPSPGPGPTFSHKQLRASSIV